MELLLPSTDSNGTGIPITEEAQELLKPCEEALERLDGQTLYYEAPPLPPDVTISDYETKSIITITKALWYKVLGDALAAVACENYDAMPHVDYPHDMGKMPPQPLDARVAQKVIECFKKYGVSL